MFDGSLAASCSRIARDRRCRVQPAIDFAQPNVANPVQRHREIAWNSAFRKLTAASWSAIASRREGVARGIHFLLLDQHAAYIRVAQREVALNGRVRTIGGGQPLGDRKRCLVRSERGLGVALIREDVADFL